MEADLGPELELIGSGSIGLTWEEWGRCFRLAKAFGWIPAGTVAPANYAPTASLTSPDCHGDASYFSGELRQVTDADAAGMATALLAAVSAWQSEQDLTRLQLWAFASVPKSLDSYIIKIADYAQRGGFLIHARLLA